MTSDSAEPALKPLVVDVLLALTERPQHGYSLMKCLRNQGNRVHTGPLYRTLRSMLDGGLIEELDEPPEGVQGDPRRSSYYRVSAAGRRVLTGELRRLDALLARGRRLGLRVAGG